MKIIPFYPCEDLQKTRELYEGVLGFRLYKDQGLCLIFEVEAGHGIGFCTHMKPLEHPENMFITFVTDDVKETERKHLQHGDRCKKPCSVDEKFRIEQSLFEDPNGYTLEIQKFLQEE